MGRPQLFEESYTYRKARMDMKLIELNDYPKGMQKIIKC